ncbi:MAG: hypothetical protein WA957_01040 [Alteraurantiacibacter sp.]
MFGSVIVGGPSVLAQTIGEPHQAAEPLNAAAWQREVGREFSAFQRFDGVPELRLGLSVDLYGKVRTCLAPPAQDSAQAIGQGLSPSLVEHARFRPAQDADGNPVESVFILGINPTRPDVAADYAGVRVN